MIASRVIANETLIGLSAVVPDSPTISQCIGSLQGYAARAVTIRSPDLAISSCHPPCSLCVLSDQ
jgi:hypothetical protein